MKKRRRIFSVVLAAIFLLCLAACQQKEPQDERWQNLADRVRGELRWFAQCWGKALPWRIPFSPLPSTIG